MEKSVTQLMKALSNEYRYKIVSLLFSSKKDMCVHEIASSVGISHSLASHQLNYLADKAILRAERKGQITCYVPATGSHAALIKKVLTVLNE